MAGLDIFRELARCSFNGTAFPIETVRQSCSQRKRRHQYPKTPGARQEKLARDVEIVRLTAIFDVGLHDRYPGLYPEGLERLLADFRAGVTGELVHPTRGKLRAFCANWTTDLDARLRSGERAELEFEEDDEKGFDLVVILVEGASALDAKADAVNAARDRSLLEEAGALFDALDDAVNAVRAVRDTADAYGQLMAAKIAHVAQICAEIDRTVLALQHPERAPVLEALLDLWASALKLAEDLAAKGAPVHTYLVPRTMALAEVSAAIYGDATHASDLFALNDVPDQLAIPAGARLKYLDAA